MRGACPAFAVQRKVHVFTGDVCCLEEESLWLPGPWGLQRRAMIAEHQGALSIIHSFIHFFF